MKLGKLYQIHFWDDKLSDFCSRPTIGIAGEGMIHMVAGEPYTQPLTQLGPVKHFRSGTIACVESLPPSNGEGYVLTNVRWFVSLSVSYTRACETSTGCLRSICLVHPGVRDKRRVSEIDLSQPRHETAFWWRHNGPVTSQLTDPIKWRNYPLQLIGI